MTGRSASECALRNLTRHQPCACEAILEAAFGSDKSIDRREREQRQSDSDNRQSDERDRWFVREEDGQTHRTDDQELRGLRG